MQRIINKSHYVWTKSILIFLISILCSLTWFLGMILFFLFFKISLRLLLPQVSTSYSRSSSLSSFSAPIYQWNFIFILDLNNTLDIKGKANWHEYGFYLSLRHEGLTRHYTESSQMGFLVRDELGNWDNSCCCCCC